MQTQRPHKPQVRVQEILEAAESLGVVGSDACGAPQLLAALCSPDAGSAEVLGLMRREPALCARVLRVANSAYYGQSRNITSIDRALVLLGLDAVRGIAAAGCLSRTFRRGSPQSLLDLRSVLDHSLATAIAAESLARMRSPGLAADAFIAGLLHNLGIMVQMQLDQRGVEAIARLRGRLDNRDIRTLEAEHASVGHEQCIAVILDSWQLPAALIAATGHHHDPMSAPEPHRRLAAFTSLGAGLALTGGIAFTLEPQSPTCDGAAMECVGLSDADLASTALDLPARVREFGCSLFA